MSKSTFSSWTRANENQKQMDELYSVLKFLTKIDRQVFYEDIKL